MPSHEFKKGDAVRVGNRTWSVGAYERQGTVGRIVTRPTEVCTNHHKADYEILCYVQFVDGVQIELDVDELEPAEAIDQLGSLAVEE